MKIFLLFLPFCILVGCDFKTEKEDPEYTKEPVSGKIYDITTHQPLPNFTLKLVESISNGILSPTTYVFLGETKTGSDGSFYFPPTNAFSLQLTISSPETFQIDGVAKLKYTVDVRSFGTEGRSNQNIGLKPNATLLVRFETDSSLTNDEYLRFHAPGEGANYSVSNQPPRAREMICQGNINFGISWILKRNGKPEESFTDTVFVNAFTKREKVVRY